MTTTVDSLVARAHTLLRDDGTRWPAAELVDWLNAGQSEIVMLQPKAGAVTANLTLTAGTLQTIPADGVQFLRAVRNMGVGGATPGKAIREIDRDTLDTHLPDWHNDAQVAAVANYVHDPITPKQFYVYPPANGLTDIEIAYAKVPATSASGGNIALDDIYANALVDYMIYRAYAKDNDTTANAERAARAYDIFLQSLGGKGVQDLAAGNGKGPTGVTANG